MKTQPPANARLEDLDGWQLYVIDFHACLLAMVGRTVYYAGQTELLSAGLARIGHPELSANPVAYGRTYGDGSIIYTAIPTPATAPEERNEDDTTDTRPA